MKQIQKTFCSLSLSLSLSLICTLLSCLLFSPSVSAQTDDHPYRGLYVNRFVNVGTPSQGIIGNNQKETELLEYARANNFKRLDLYRLEQIFPDYLNLINPVSGNTYSQDLCDFIHRAKNEYCIEQIAAVGENSNFFSDANDFNTLHITPPFDIETSTIPNIDSVATLFSFVGNIYSASDGNIALNAEIAKYFLRLIEFSLSSPEAPGSCVFDVFTIEYEYWRSPYDWDFFTTLLGGLRTLQTTTPTSPFLIHVYTVIREFTASSGSIISIQQEADFIDDNADRIYLTNYPYSPTHALSPARFWNVYYFRDGLQAFGTNSKPYTIITPLFNNMDNSEGLYTWLNDPINPQNTLFKAEDIFWQDKSIPSNSSLIGNSVLTHGSYQWFKFSDAKQISSNSVNNLWCTNNEVFYVQGNTIFCPGNTSVSSCTGNPVTFIYIANYESGVSCTWNFGDGSDPINASPGNQTHTFDQPGTYTVSCTLIFPPSTIISTQPCEYIFTREVVVGGVGITSDGPLTFCQGGAVTLSSSASSGNTWKKDGVNIGSAQAITVNQSGVYSVTTGNHNGCTASTSTVEVIVHTNPTASISSSTNILCFGDANGSATASVSGGTTPYTYSWSPGGSTGLSISGLAAGNYTFTVTDDEGCTGSIGVTITQPNQLLATPSPTHVSCFGQANGIAGVGISGGTSPYTYSWTPGGATTSQLTGLSPGTYTANITDANGCSTTAGVVVSQPSVLTATTYQSVIGCLNSNLNSAGVNPIGGTTPYTFLWNNGQTTQQTTTVLTPGNYSVLVTDANGCTVSSATTIQENSNCCGQYGINFTATSGSFSGQDFNLNSSFTLTGNLTFDNCTLSIAEGVQITVPANTTLTISNTSHLYACAAPWQGIVLNDPSSSVFVEGGSIIEDANIGIEAGSDALVEIRNSTFKDNGIGIRLHDGAFSNFVADGATFNGASGFYPKFGIQLENVHSAGIGNSSYDMNSFNELNAGIFSLTSNVTVQHCTFNNNQKPCLPGAFDCYTGQGSGIIAQGDPGSVFELIVGGSQSEACYFNNNTQGIFTKTNVELTATFNEFNNIGYMNQHKSFGIYAMIASNATQTVNDNLLNRLDYGVWFSNIRDAEISINNNLFNNFYSVPARQGERAITLWNTTTHPNPQLKTITYNSIQHYTQGISLTHQEVAEVKNNSFNFDRLNPSTLWYGVRVLGGRKNTISLNWMNRTGAQPDLSLGRNMHGISIERSEENDVLENDIHNLGSGIRYFGTSVINTVRCNNLIYNVDNLVLESAIIGDQGSATDASDNFWFINSNTEQTSSGYGNILNIGNPPSTPPTFYVQHLAGYNPDYGGTQACPYVCQGFAAIIDNNAVSQNNCANTNCTTTECFQEMIANIINEQAQYADLPDEQEAKARDYAFELLLRDSTLMYLGTTLDAILRDFYLEMREENPGLFNEIIGLLQQEDFTGAILINSSITPENLSESNQQLFNEIFFETWAENQFELDANQQSILEFIAYQNPYSGGDAVYSARVMLSLDLNDVADASQERRRGNKKEVEADAKGIIIPNPNTGKMSYIYESEEVGKLQIFSSRGRLIKSYNLSPESKTLNIDLSDQVSGIYVYRVVTNDKIYPGSKILLQK